MTRHLAPPLECKHVFSKRRGVRKAMQRCVVCGILAKDSAPPKWKHCVGEGWKDQSHDVKLMCEEFLEWLSHNHPSVQPHKDRMDGSPIQQFYRARARKSARSYNREVQPPHKRTT